MSEKINFTTDQILSLGKISAVEKGGITHSITYSLISRLAEKKEGKNIKKLTEIEKFYREKISAETKKELLKLAMELEKQLPANRKKRGKYKIIYKTDEFDVGKVDKSIFKKESETKNNVVEDDDPRGGEQLRTTVTTKKIEKKASETKNNVVEDDDPRGGEQLRTTVTTNKIEKKASETQTEEEITYEDINNFKSLLSSIIETEDFDFNGVGTLEESSRKDFVEKFINFLNEENPEILINLKNNENSSKILTNSLKSIVVEGTDNIDYAHNFNDKLKIKFFKNLIEKININL